MKMKLEELVNQDDKLIKLSYSRVSDFDKNGPKTLLERTELKGKGLSFGKLVDELIINPTNIQKKYVVFDGEKPTAMLGQLTDYILNNYKKIPKNKEILKIIKDLYLWRKSSDDVKIKKYDIPEFWNYLDTYLKKKNKIVIGTSDYMNALECKTALFNHKFSKHIFNNNNENIYQYKISFIYKEVLFRGYIDILSIDHKNKTIYIRDLKTGSDKGLNFISSFIKFKYYLQEAVYSLAIESIKKELNLKDYKLAPFEFIYISKFEKIPIIYKVTKKWTRAALNGFKTSNGYYYRGLNELINEIKWHHKEKKYDYIKKLYNDDGVLNMEDNFININ